MLQLSFLEKAASKALRFRDLICIAAYSTSPTTAYKVALELGWFEDKVKSCRYLALILRDYGEEKFEDIVFKRGPADCESICFCECHLQGWNIDVFLDFEPVDCECECCDHGECLHAIHSFGEENDLCPICDSYYDPYDSRDEYNEEGDNEYYEDGEEDEYDNDEEDAGDEENYEGGEEDDDKNESPSSNPTPANRLEIITERLQKVTNTNYSVKIVQSNDLNGWADGKSVSITSGAVDSLDDEELAYLISHEISHNVNRHKSQRVRRIKDLSDGVDMATGLVGSIMVAVLGHAANRFTDRDEEYIADEEAKEIMRKAGYNPEKAAGAIRRIDPQYNNRGGVFSTHPSTFNRAERLKK